MPPEKLTASTFAVFEKLKVAMMASASAPDAFVSVSITSEGL